MRQYCLKSDLLGFERQERAQRSADCWLQKRALEARVKGVLLGRRRRGSRAPPPAVRAQAHVASCDVPLQARVHE